MKGNSLSDILKNNQQMFNITNNIMESSDGFYSLTGVNTAYFSFNTSVYVVLFRSSSIGQIKVFLDTLYGDICFEEMIQIQLHGRKKERNVLKNSDLSWR